MRATRNETDPSTQPESSSTPGLLAEPEASAGHGSTGPGPTPALRSVRFGSFFVYSPRGAGRVSELSRLVCVRLKSGDPAWLASYARQVREEVTRHETLAGLFSGDTCLVPVPGSSASPTGVCAAERLAAALCGMGLAKVVWPGLRRQHTVRKSATASSLDRPSVRQHVDSLSVVMDPPRTSRRLVLVDDVITRGRTILAAALRLQQALPDADIRAFALVRTLGFLTHVPRFIEPCQGFVRWAGGDARREP